MIFIGDVHGKFEEYQEIIKKFPATIQLGDMGVGFGIPFPKVASFHRFIRGNHDNPDSCVDIDNYMGDYGLTNGRIFYLSGALSVDKAVRTEGVNWWRNEELDYQSCCKALDAYKKLRPRIVASHTCPDFCVANVGGKSFGDTVTGQLMNLMYEFWQPQIWIFAHFHTSKEFVIGQTKFICLNELEVKDA